VRGDEDGPLAVADRANEAAHLVDSGGVEPVRRLVQDEEHGVSEQRSGNTEALLHPERILTKSVRPSRVEADEREQLRDAALVMTAENGQRPEVLDAGETGPEGGGLN
jgi:hypothetical protein